MGKRASSICSRAAGSCSSTTSCSARTRTSAAMGARWSSTSSPTSGTCTRATRALRSSLGPRSRSCWATGSAWGWDDIPWYSWGGGDYGVDLGLSPPEPQPGTYQDGEMFGLNAFLRDDQHEGGGHKNRDRLRS